jgi:AraC family transcriptional regulator, melibiose operon regulatory protein
MDQPVKPQSVTQSAERRFYARSKAFGRFGMRIFKPLVMPRPHAHGHVEANYLSNARMHYVVDGERVVVEPNNLVIFWANVPHQLVAIEPINSLQPELLNIYLPLDSFLFMSHIQDLQVKILTGAMLIVPQANFESQVLRRWYEDYRAHDAARAELVMMEINALFWRTSLEAYQYLRKPWRDKASKSSSASVHVRHVVSMVRHILENIEKPLTNHDVTAVTGLHSNYALALFSKTMLISPKQFIIRMRLLRARSLLLESKLAISSVAVECGFNSMSQFYDHFSAAYGTTPQKMRVLQAASPQNQLKV